MERAVTFVSFLLSEYALKNSVGFFKCCLLDQVLIVNSSQPDPGLKEKINLNFYFHTIFEAFIKPFEVPQRSMKIIMLNLIFFSFIYFY